MDRQECVRLAHAAARNTGAANFADLYLRVVSVGWRPGMDAPRFIYAQSVFHHVAQPLMWAAEARGAERERWIRCAHLGALYVWLRANFP